VTPRSRGASARAKAGTSRPDAKDPVSDAEGRGPKAAPATPTASASPAADRPQSRVASTVRRGRDATRTSTNISMPSISVPALGDISSSATRIIQQAANVLEEEVAAGIQAARDVESRFVDVEQARTYDSAEVISRIRKDAHELIDILVDLVGVAGGRTGDVVDMVTSMGKADEQRDGQASGRNRAASRARARPSGDGPSVSMLAVPTSITPGSSAEVIMAVDNDGATPTGRFRFLCSDLIDADGHRIPPDAVRFKPATLSLAPGSTTRMKVTVTPPPGTPPGSYSGVLRATKLKQLKAVLSFEVD
jgi:hypothetical protein